MSNRRYKRNKNKKLKAEAKVKGTWTSLIKDYEYTTAMLDRFTNELYLFITKEKEKIDNNQEVTIIINGLVKTLKGLGINVYELACKHATEVKDSSDGTYKVPVDFKTGKTDDPEMSTNILAIATGYLGLQEKIATIVGNAVTTIYSKLYGFSGEDTKTVEEFNKLSEYTSGLLGNSVNVVDGVNIVPTQEEHTNISTDSQDGTPNSNSIDE